LILKEGLVGLVWRLMMTDHSFPLSNVTMIRTVLPFAVGFRSLIVVLMILAGSLAANASIEYQFNTPFSGDPNPAGTGPWIDAYFIDVTPGEVLLTVTNVNLTAGEFIQGNGSGASGGLYFNINPNDTVTDLHFTLVSETANFGTIISTGEDAFKADGDGEYDVQFDFADQTFSVDSSFTYEITGISSLTAADFAYLSTPAGGQGPFYAAAKIQGLANGNSTFLEPGGGPETVVTPEPTSLVLLAAGTGLFFARTIRARRA
jgi:hypothetical protein